MKKPFVIGISGSIGSGKSLIRHLLAVRGVLTIDADELTHFVLAKGKAGHAAAVELFGKDILKKNGEVNRGTLGEIVFKDPLALRKLEERMHPLVNKSLQNILTNANCPIAAVEAIKLYDSELIYAVDSRWFVTATSDVQIKRLKSSRGMTHTEIKDRLRMQSFPKEMQIDFFIENSQQIKAAWEQVAFIWGEISQTVPAFRKAIEQMPRELTGSISDIPAVEQIKPEELQRILHILENDCEEYHCDAVLQSHAFLLPLEQENTHLVWKFDHFNTRIEGVSQNCDKILLFSGLEKLEKITHFWGGNCVLVRLSKEDGAAGQNLLKMGYQVLTPSNIDRFPYLLPEKISNNVAMNWYIKAVPDGIWRFIP